ncbi:MAG: extracellular solute-binding protein [Candidatus Pacebacteria bacterium]|nr:extracellular solute-binding protein [Candidatus Paceibacterota bacterium]
MTRFQLITLIIFGVFIVTGVIIFSTNRGSGPGPNGNIEVWGTISESVIAEAIRSHSLLGTKKEVIVTYVQKNALTIEKELIEALAEDRGPDIVMLPQDALWEHRNKIFPVPYKSFSERQFKDTFIEEGELYLFPEGVMGFPILVDPLVMYWNRTLFSNAGISRPPQYWDELFNLSTILTKKDQSLNILESAIAFGEYRNVVNAKDIISALVIQAGSPITTRKADGIVSLVFGEKLGKPTIPAVAAINFFTEFSNPIKLFYSWNRSLSRSDNAFLGGDLAIYFGFASEFISLKNKNPNLNFDVALFPQARGEDTRSTFGKVYALSVLKTSDNITDSIRVAYAFAEATVASVLSGETTLPPARRDLLSQNKGDAYSSIFYQSALRSQAWLDPENTATGAIFQSMIESVTGGRTATTEAVLRAHAEMAELFRSSQ